MKNDEYTHSAPEFEILPYIYGRRTDLDAASREQRIPLFQSEEVYPPQLETLKAKDPDSYRMVIYSWG